MMYERKSKPEPRGETPRVHSLSVVPPRHPQAQKVSTTSRRVHAAPAVYNSTPIDQNHSVFPFCQKEGVVPCSQGVGQSTRLDPNSQPPTHLAHPSPPVQAPRTSAVTSAAIQNARPVGIIAAVAAGGKSAVKPVDPGVRCGLRVEVVEHVPEELLPERDR